MKAHQIRSLWLQFFATKGHHIAPSASLVPHDDPTLLWINAGMAPLKPYFDGRVVPPHPRIANAQKCIRTNDIEHVGFTKRHQTFFEMLGNFSLGDYFKHESIVWAWEFLTGDAWLALDVTKLHVTVHPDDDDADAIWREHIGLSPDRIHKNSDNFWDIGEGPCGPCSEIFYDRGVAYESPDATENVPGGENERYLEIWNLVFSQFNHLPDGSYVPLPTKNIDTGAGLERIASVMQGVDSNFDTDLFLPLIVKTCALANVTYRTSPETDVALKVIADHVRAVVFALSDGVMPSNEGRGYVIRRMLRRAVRYGRSTLGMQEPFLHALVADVVALMGEAYPHVIAQQARVTETILTEEQRFHVTLTDGLHILDTIIAQAQQHGKTTISGDQAFKLYDTYGFPLDLTVDYAREKGMTVDTASFAQHMDEQRQRAREARQDVRSMQAQDDAWLTCIQTSEFVGYVETAIEATVVAVVDVPPIEDAPAYQCVVLDRTPFYVESGGQVSDEGTLTPLETNQSLSVVRVFRAPHGQTVHEVVRGEHPLRVGDRLHATIDVPKRLAIARNHTATHLLHDALRRTLGDTVHQAGSQVSAERLRFDFTFPKAVTPAQCEAIVQRVNAYIWASIPVTTSVMEREQAMATGAMALFGEKYGQWVRVVEIASTSTELCGGCHVPNTAHIGLFQVVSESSVGSGIRRIEAVTGEGAYRHVAHTHAVLARTAAALKVPNEQVPAKLEATISELKEAQRHCRVLREKIGRIEVERLVATRQTYGKISVIASPVEEADFDTLRQMADALRTRHRSVVVVLASVVADKVNLICALTPDLVSQGHSAVQWIRVLAPMCGGGGGGRTDFAQAGGKWPHKLQDVFDHVPHMVQQLTTS